MESQVFDYIVVGAGSAGSVLANRLSADPKHRVLVLEAGRESHPWSRIPVGFAKLIQNPAANWLYSSEPDDGTGQRRIPIPRGKLLGGSSSINGMVFVRGQSQDYDTWAQLGNRGWSYREVLPIFKEMESYQGDGDDEYRGRNGPLKVSESNESGALYDALIKAAGEVGIAYTKDYNGAQQDGIGMTQTTIRGGRRMSTAVCYLDPARRRPNLKIQANALTECLLFDGKRCVGVVYSLGRPAIRSPRQPGSRRQRRLDQLAAAAGIVRHRPAGSAPGGRHRGAPRAARRRRKPARPLFAAHEMGGAARARDDLQRQGARPRHGVAGAAICDDAQGAAWACRRRRSAPMSAPAPGSMRRTPRSRGSRFWSATISSWRRIPASPRS